MYYPSTTRRCRSPKINMRLVSSALTVPTNRSAKQFARGQRRGILTTWMPTSARTASNDPANWPARSRTKPKFSDAIAEIHHQVADLLGRPSAVWVGGRAQQVHGSGGDLQPA